MKRGVLRVFYCCMTHCHRPDSLNLSSPSFCRSKIWVQPNWVPSPDLTGLKWRCQLRVQSHLGSGLYSEITAVSRIYFAKAVTWTFHFPSSLTARESSCQAEAAVFPGLLFLTGSLQLMFAFFQATQGVALRVSFLWLPGKTLLLKGPWHKVSRPTSSSADFKSFLSCCG